MHASIVCRKSPATAYLLLRAFLLTGAYLSAEEVKVDLTVNVESNTVVLSWTSEVGKTYAVQQVVNMENGPFSLRNLSSGLAATPPRNEYHIPLSQNQGYFRVRGEPDLPSLPETPYSYANAPLPEHFRVNGFPSQQVFQAAPIEWDNSPADNPVTDAGATLGRVLFYDKKLSANGNISCASCHIQAFGFSDPAVRSLGFEAVDDTRRHSMGLANARFYRSGRFFWDERAATLEAQVLMPFQDPVEMGLSLTELVSLVEAQPYYPPLFAAAFGDEGVDSGRIARALAQFVRSLVSFSAPYDQGRALVGTPLQDFPTFTDQENLGKRLFMQSDTRPVNCIGCHATEAFVNASSPDPSVTSAFNIGLDASSPADDLGVRETTGRVRDSGKFKVPSLRNIAVRPPYMHDGRFATLEEVIGHYSTGVQDHPQLSFPLRDAVTGEPIRLNFTPEEVAALVAFLHTLTDESFLNDPKFGDPFH
jgi:cytochrome c peroxidase